MTAARCSHRWKYERRAKDYRGEHCCLWRCVMCRKPWELYVGVNPNASLAAKRARSASVGVQEEPARSVSLPEPPETRKTSFEGSDNRAPTE